jgi:serine protease Do
VNRSLSPAHRLTGAIVIAASLLPRSAAAAPDTPARAVDSLARLSGSIEELVAKVSASVVQVRVSGFATVPSNEDGMQPTVDRQRNIGSGVIIDGDGYIVTNAHVVSGARQIDVLLPTRVTGESGVRALVSGRGELVPATLVGVAQELDLALLKVERTGLSALPIGDYDAVKQGQLVFAFGSPSGMQNSVSMGVVSAVARQPHPDNPLVYVQTDAPINPGNSGGPLVNVAGELVGINTFIVSQSGGSEGLGFAIPGPLVQLAYPRLRQYGHLHRGTLGITFQTVTPLLAAGLGLAQDSGVIVADVVPGGPADVADLLVQDIIVSVDGRPVDSLPFLGFQLFTRSAGDRVRLGIRRGGELLTRDVVPVEAPHSFDQMSELADPASGSVPRLGVMGIDVRDGVAAGQAVTRRLATGVLIAARIPAPTAIDIAVATGDVIHAVNNHPVSSVSELNAALDTITPRAALVLQVERDGARRVHSTGAWQAVLSIVDPGEFCDPGSTHSPTPDAASRLSFNRPDT